MHREIHSALRRAHRRRLAFLVLLVLLAFAAVSAAWLYLQDEDRPQDADLLMEQPLPPSAIEPVAAAKWRLALQAVLLPDAPSQVLKPAWDWDTPLLSRTVQANGMVFKQLEEALAVEDWQTLHPVWRSAEIGSHEGFDSIGIVSSALIAYVARKGDEKGAVQAAVDVAALGRRLQNISSWPTYYNHGLRLQQRAAEGLAEVLRTTSLDARTLNQLQREFEKSMPSDSQLRDACNGFYQFERLLFTGPRAEDPWDMLPGGLPVQTQSHSRWFFKPYATLAMFSKGFRALKGEVMKPPYAWVDQLRPIVGPPGRPLETQPHPNFAGSRHANQRLWPYAQLMENHALQRTRHLLVLSLFAVRSYGLDHGRIPSSLADLSPRYFTSLPMDPFSSEPLHYDASKGVIYSVGLDLKDDGGSKSPLAMSDPYEPTVRIR